MYIGLIRICLLMGIFTISMSAMGIKEVLRETIETNPHISQKIHEYKEVVEDLQIAKKGWKPTLDYLGSMGKEWTKNSSTGFENVNYNVYQHSLILTQNIFSGWSTTHQINIQKARIAASAYHMIETVNDTAFNLVRYYIEVLKSKELLNVANENIDIVDSIYQKVQKLYNAGLTTKSERNKVAASLALSKSNYITQENRLQNALYQFKFYYGKSVKTDDFIDPDTSFPMPHHYKDGLDRTLKNNPSIIVQSYNIKVAKEDYLEKKSKYYPKVDIELRRSWSRNLGAVVGRDDRYSALLKVQYNFFNGFKDKSTLQKGISKINKEAQLLEKTKREAMQTYDLSWAAYEELQKQWKHLEEYKKYAVRTLRLYSKEFDMGKRSLLDLLSAQNDIINSKSQIIRTKYNFMFAKYRILDSQGDLLTAILDKNRPYNLKEITDKLPKSK